MWCVHSHISTVATTHLLIHSLLSPHRPTQPHNTSPQAARCLCVLRAPELLCVYPPDGQVYEVPLPCHVQRLWALGAKGGGGLLIQRQPVRMRLSAR